MHILQHVQITNYRSIKAAEFELSEYTPFVGYNNAGKSNVLKAMTWLLKKSTLSSSDFYDQQEPVVVTGRVSGVTADVLALLDEKHRTKIAPFLSDGVLTIRRSQPTPNCATKDILLAILKPDTGDWLPNPSGIDQAITAMFPEPIGISAMQDAAEDVAKFGTKTTIGQLLTEIMQPIRDHHSAAIEAALSGIRETLSADGNEKDARLVEIDTMMAAEIGKFFPGISAKTHIPVPQFDDFLKGGTIKVYEDGGPAADGGRLVGQLGHGSQRAIQIALISCLSSVRAQGGADGVRTTLLLIDEPELYLHPQAIERVRIALKTLSKNGYQVVFTTHSANMIARDDAENVVFIRRSTNDGTVSRPRIADAVKAAIADADHQSEVLFSLTNSSKILFCDAVVIAEGKTEHRLLPDIIEVKIGKTLESMKVALIELSGSSNIPAAMNVLQSMGLPVKAVVDLDFVFRVAPSIGVLATDNPDVAACKAILQVLEGNGIVALSQDGYPKKHNGNSAAHGFAQLAKDAVAKTHIAVLHGELKQSGIWVWTDGVIEDHLGLASKTASAWSGFLNQLQADPSLAFIPNATSVDDLCSWLDQ